MAGRGEGPLSRTARALRPPHGTPPRPPLGACTRPPRALSASPTATAKEEDRRKASPRSASHARAYPLNSADSANSRELAWAAARRAL